MVSKIKKVKRNKCKKITCTNVCGIFTETCAIPAEFMNKKAKSISSIVDVDSLNKSNKKHKINGLVGCKIGIKECIDRPIIIFKTICNIKSKINKNQRYMVLQFSFIEMKKNGDYKISDENMYVMSTGSDGIYNIIKNIPKEDYPITAKIVYTDERKMGYTLTNPQ